MAHVPILNDLPVDDSPQGLELVGAAVLPVKIVGVLPNIEGQQGSEVPRDWVVGPRLLGDDQTAIRSGGEPDPAGAEKADALGDELVLEGIHAAPLAYDLLSERPCGRGGFRRRTELREIQVVVEDLAGVVEDGALAAADDLLQRLRLERRAGDQAVEVVHIALQVLAMVELDRAGADDRLQGIGRVGELNKLVHFLGNDVIVKTDYMATRLKASAYGMVSIL